MYYNYITRGGNSVVECLLAKEDVASSSLVSRSKISRWTLVPSAYFVRQILARTRPLRVRRICGRTTHKVLVRIARISSLLEPQVRKRDYSSVEQIQDSLVSRSIKKSPSKGSFLLRFSLIKISEILTIFYPKGTIRGLFKKIVDFTSFEQFSQIH